jgi:hypothetical protein
MILSLASVTLDTAQIAAAIEATPATIIAAPGAGKILVPVSNTYVYNFLTSPYAGGEPGGIAYNGITFIDDSDFGILGDPASHFSNSAIEPIGADLALFENLPLTYSTLGATPWTGGLGSLTINIAYYEVVVV